MSDASLAAERSRDRRTALGERAAADGMSFDEQTLLHAKLFRRLRFDRAALRAARTGLLQAKGRDGAAIGPKLIKWLSDFAAEF